MSAALLPTEQTVEGPFYRPGAPLLSPPYSLILREGERGAVLVFSGTVQGIGGQALAGAELDLWQSTAGGAYSPGADGGSGGGLFDVLQPAFNLRGRIVAGGDGAFEVRSVVPGVYRVPTVPVTEAATRPAHLHAKVSHPGYVPLTTQLFFEEDPYLETDPAGVVRPGLVMRLVRRSDPADLAARGLLRPYFACSFAFVLALAVAPALA